MCASAIAWAGFREVWMLYGYEAVKEGFDMPVDLTMYREIFGADGPRAENAFYTLRCLRDEAAKYPGRPALASLLAEIGRRLARDAGEGFRVSGDAARRRALKPRAAPGFAPALHIFPAKQAYVLHIFPAKSRRFLHVFPAFRRGALHIFPNGGFGRAATSAKRY